MTIQELVLPTLMRDEGFRATPYLDSRGYWTIGYGTNLSAGIDADEAMFLLEHRLNKAILACRQAFPWFDDLDPARRGVVAMLCYQLGLEGLRGFRRMLAALQRHDYDTAADELLDSKLAGQAPARTRRHAQTLRTGR